MSINNFKIGDIFTPIPIATIFIEQFNVFDKWLNGAKIFDPTMGNGNLIISLMEYGLSKGYTVDELPVNNLYGNELNREYFDHAIYRFQQVTEFKINLENFSNKDFFDIRHPQKFDIIFGNPPWINYNDLPIELKKKYAPVFFEYHLASKDMNLLLGNSRIDLAALVIQKSISDFLCDNGEAIFFLPLSLFHNDGATKNFRNFKDKNNYYSVECIYELNGMGAFNNVSTKYGVARFIKNQKSNYPIPYFIYQNGEFVQYSAKPLHNHNDPFFVYEKHQSDINFEKITIPEYSQPRQGINTCGANSVYFIDVVEECDSDYFICKMNQQKHILPKKFIYPLITSSLFKNKGVPEKYLLLPYYTNGKPLSWTDIEKYPELKNYLNTHKELLQKRKGVMINTWIKKGYWWALLGVGEYSFYSYKIVWEAYGKNTFNPILIDGKWQANQSLQAYIPCKSKEEAEKILYALQKSEIEKFLKSFQTAGTMNWAQPGKIKRFLKIQESPTLFET